ncbi:MAG: tetratricopeptide repeat protein [Myxococcota bacterium]
MMGWLTLVIVSAVAPPRDGPAPLALRGSEVDMDARADAKRDEAIEKLKRLLPTVSEGPQKAELVFRLSEMYWAKSKFARLRAMQAWDQSLEKWTANGKRGEEPTLEREPKSAESAAYRADALKLYQQILAQYPSYERRDEVLYSLASAQYDAGETKLGVETFWTLIKEYPDSVYAADAWLQLGEHFFNGGKLVNAVKAYEAAAATKRPRVYAYAMYKLAWCDFNLQDYPAALAKFRAVVAYAKEQRAGGEGELGEHDRLQLLDEALNDMVRVYSHMDSFEDAFAYYQGELPPAKARGYLRKLAKRYDEEGKHLLEIKACSRLINEDPDAVDAPQLQVGIVSAYAQMGRNDDVRREVRRLIDVYSPGGTWAKRNAGNAQAVDQANGVVENELGKLVVEQHRAAQQTKLTDSFMLARDLYREYLDKFPDSPNATRFRFFLAEIAFELKEFALAAEQFAAVVASDPKSELAPRAAYSAIMAWDKVVSGARETVGTRIVSAKAGKRVDLTPDLKASAGKGELSPAREKLIAACDAYVDLQPNDPEIAKVRFKAASQFYAAGRYDEAAARFQTIIAKHPRDPLARTSAEAILESFAARKDWADLAKNARALAANRELMSDRAFAERVNDYGQAAAFNEVLYVIEPKGDQRATAQGYAGFVRDFPKSKYAATARYNAMLAYDKAHDLDAALAVGAPALGDGDDEVRAKAVMLTAELHERVGSLSAAAAVLERRGREKKDVDLLLRAAADREGAADYDAAVADYLAAADLLRASGKDLRAATVAWKAGAALEAKQDAKAAHAFFERYANDYAAGDEAKRYCADYAAAKWAGEAGISPKVTMDAVARSYDRLSAKAKRDACVKSAGAAAAFAAIEPDYRAAIGITLTGAEKEVTQKLVKKLAAVDAVQKRYIQVIAMGEGTQGIAALYRIGTLYKNLSKAMFDSPCPKRLSGEQCSIYHQELGDRAFPLEERAIEAFDKAAAKAYELGLYDEWLTRSQEALKGYEPKRYAEPPPAAPTPDPALMPPPGGAS